MNASRCIRGALGAYWLFTVLMVSSWQTQAQPIVYQATGTREQIQPVVDQFKHDIVYGLTNSEQNPPPFLGAFKVATMDDVSPLTDSGFLSGGLAVMVAWPKTGVDLVSVTNTAQAFSPPNELGLSSMIPLSLHVQDVNLALEDAIGCVFANVSETSTANLIYRPVQTPWTGYYKVPTTVGSDTFTFVGLLDPNHISFWTAEINLSPQVFLDDIILGHTGDLIIPEPRSLALLSIGLLAVIICGASAR